MAEEKDFKRYIHEKYKFLRPGGDERGGFNTNFDSLYDHASESQKENIQRVTQNPTFYSFIRRDAARILRETRVKRKNMGKPLKKNEKAFILAHNSMNPIFLLQESMDHPDYIIHLLEDAGKSDNFHRYLDENVFNVSMEKVQEDERQFEENQRKKSLENTVFGIIGIIGFGVALLFLSTNLTGYIIGNLSQSSLNFFGAVLFLVGLTGTFFYFKNKIKLKDSAYA